MRNLFSSIQFQLVMGFAAILFLALGAVSIYTGVAARRESNRYQEELETARAQQVQQLIARRLRERQGPSSLQAMVEEASVLYGWRLVVTDPNGEILADSTWLATSAADVSQALPIRSPREFSFDRPRWFRRDVPLTHEGNPLGSLAIGPAPKSPEPSLSRLTNSVNTSLIWTGIAAGLGGFLLIGLLSRRVLAPVNALRASARRLGDGDFSQRVPASSSGEVGELAHAFNTMASNLERMEAQRRSLLADVAHELRTPLSNLVGYLEAVQDGVLQPDAATIKLLHQQAVHLSRLVEDLRLLALAETGTLRLDIQAVRLDEALAKSVEAFKLRAEEKRVVLTLRVPDSLPPVTMDRTRFAQVMENLLANALQHTPEGGSVSISAELAEPDSVRVTVADTGEGIPEDALPRIFERFYRVDPSRSRDTGGTGLGLAIAKYLIEAQGGTIGVESIFGEGSRFILMLRVGNQGYQEGQA